MESDNSDGRYSSFICIVNSVIIIVYIEELCIFSCYKFYEMSHCRLGLLFYRLHIYKNGTHISYKTLWEVSSSLHSQS